MVNDKQAKLNHDQDAAVNATSPEKGFIKFGIPTNLSNISGLCSDYNPFDFRLDMNYLFSGAP